MLQKILTASCEKRHLIHTNGSISSSAIVSSTQGDSKNL